MKVQKMSVAATTVGAVVLLLGGICFGWAQGIDRNVVLT